MTPTRCLRLNARYWRAHGAHAVSTGFATDWLALEVDETALLLVDVYCNEQEGSPSPISQALSKMWDKAVANLVHARDAAHIAKLPVVYVTNSAPRIGLQRSEFGAHFVRAWDRSVVETFREGAVDPRQYHGGRSGPLRFPRGLEPQPCDLYIRKHTYSGFFDTRLDTALRNTRVRNLVCGGFWADACLMATSLDAFYRNYRVVWLRDGTVGGEDPGQEDQLVFTERVIRWFETLIGWTVTTAEFVEACQALREPGPV